MIARAGRLLCCDEGQYSDYGVIGFFVVLHDFDPMKELTEYLDANPEKREHYEFEGSGFVAFLTGKGLLLEIEYATLYCGDYGGWENVEFRGGEVSRRWRRYE